MASWAAVLWTCPVTTILAGSVTPPANSRSRVRKACFDEKSSGSWLTVCEVPRFSWRVNDPSPPRIATARTREVTGRAITPRVTRSQKPPFGSWEESTRARLASLGQLMRSPRRPRIAGRRVIDAAREASVTRMAPAPKLRKIDAGTMNIPSRASTTVRPLKNTARLAVAPAAPMASSLGNPFFRSSRYRDTMNSE
jgi:hypothetical protein